VHVLHTRFFYKENKIKISNFGGISKFLELIVFGQILTKFGGFRQFWVDLATMAMADSMSSFKRKTRKHHNFCKKSQNLACNGLLKSLLKFPSPKKFQKIQLQN
jgi:hypothetical protein